jgi:formimidoylglutamate deiminase
MSSQGENALRKLFFDTALTARGWQRNVTVTIGADGMVTAVAADAPADDAERVRGAAIPGLANVHSHAFQRGMAGLAERAGATDDSFWTWREVMYHFLGRLSPDDVEAIAALAYAEMLEGGFTVVGEFHYLHHDPAGQPYAEVAEMASRIARAAVDSGIGLTLLPVFYAHGNFGGAEPTTGQRRFLSDLDGFARLLEASRRAIATVPRARLGIAPHSLRATTLEELRTLVAAAPSGPVHIHVAEQVKEVEDCVAAHGRRPVELLFDSVSVDPRWCLIHATHTDEAERAAMAASGAAAGLCPITESNLGDGIFAAKPYLAAGGRFGIGTDSNILVSAPAELRALEYSQRLALRMRNALSPRGASTGRILFEEALVGGGRALDLGIVGLRPGARADIVVLDTDQPAFTGRSGDALLDTLVFTAGERAIREVWSLGRRVVVDGRHIARERIAARYVDTLTRLLTT